MQKPENIYNVPNTITLIRVIITVILAIAIINDVDLITISVLFIVGMLTDFFDGQIARRWKLVTDFGRRFDMVADRLLMATTVIGVIYLFSINGYTDHLRQVLMLMTREMIGLPTAAYAFIMGKELMPQVRWSGKITTFLQGVTFPMIILSLYYSVFNISIYFAEMTAVVGLVSAMFYVKDISTSK